jgi:ribosomal protein L37AE/L43A
LQPSPDDDREPELVRRSPLAPATKLCPRCLSPLVPRSKFGGWLFPQDYYCNKCGYAGSAFLERSEEPPGDKEER